MGRGRQDRPQFNSSGKSRPTETASERSVMAEGGTELVVGLQENDTLGLDHTRMIKKWQHWEQNLVEQREEVRTDFGFNSSHWSCT